MNKPYITTLTLLLLSAFLSTTVSAETKELLIYHDADYSGHSSSAESMAMGFKTAMFEINNEIQGFEIKLVAKDHRGNVKRSKRHMAEFLNDPKALLMLGGLHSPPYLANRDFINENAILLLVPWAAAGPITRYDKGTNWVFRVSVDDTKAGIRLAQFAQSKKHCKAPHLLLENTGWGKSNLRTISNSFKALGIEVNGVSWFDWNTKGNTAKGIIETILDNQADCLVFVGNAIEGRVFAELITQAPKTQKLPMISHWGITGGNFHNTYQQALHGKIDLSFLQSCFSFNTGTLNQHAVSVLAKAKVLFNEQISKPEDILAPPGFIHAYDMGRILAAAASQVKLGDDMMDNREQLRIALENVSVPVQGLVKNYEPPFMPWSPDKPDAHEALGLDNFCMASYDSAGIIRLID